MKSRITLTPAEVNLASALIAMEDEREAWNDSHTTTDNRIIGVLGEMAVVKYLNARYGTQRVIVPMSIAARTGMIPDGYDAGDVLTMQRSPAKHRLTHIYEVKAYQQGVGRPGIIRCDQAEMYLARHVDSVFFVGVEFTGEGAQAVITHQVSPCVIVDEWPTSKNFLNQECYKMPA